MTGRKLAHKNGFIQEARVLAGYFGRNKIVAMVVVRCYFLHIFKYVTEIVKYCDVCQHMSLYILQKSEEPLHAIPVPLKIKGKMAFICLVH